MPSTAPRAWPAGPSAETGAGRFKRAVPVAALLFLAMSCLRTLTLRAALATTLAFTPIFAAQAAGAASFVDGLDTPARLSPRAVRSPIFALAPVDADHIVVSGRAATSCVRPTAARPGRSSPLR